MAERPRAEPEIIPPDRHGRRSGWRRQNLSPESSAFGSETHRIYVGRVGPLGIAVLLLIAGVLAAVIVLAVIGAVLFWLPLLLLLVIAGAIVRYLRR